MEDFEKLRNELTDTMKDLRDGKISPSEAKKITAAANKKLKAAQLEMKQMKQMKQKK